MRDFTNSDRFWLGVEAVVVAFSAALIGFGYRWIGSIVDDKWAALGVFAIFVTLLCIASLIFYRLVTGEWWDEWW